MSLAEARARGPLVLRPWHADLHHALHAAVDGARDEFVQRKVRITQHAPQHRHVDAGDDARTHTVGHRQRGLARRRAEDIGQDQHFVVRQTVDHGPDLRLGLGRAGASVDVDGRQTDRTDRVGMVRHGQQGGGLGGVGDEQDGGHGYGRGLSTPRRPARKNQM